MGRGPFSEGDLRREEDVAWRSKLREEDLAWRQAVRHDEVEARDRNRTDTARLENRRAALLAATQSLPRGAKQADIEALANRFLAFLEKP